MKRFEDWLRDGPLAGERLNERELIIAQVAYNEAAANAMDQTRAAMERILQGRPLEEKAA